MGDDLIKWSRKSMPDLVLLAENRLAYQQFIYGVAHARELSMAP